MAKSCVTPLKFLSVPRLELTAATLAVKVATHLKQESDIKVDEEVFWTDSKVLLSYIQNNKRCFKMFVANQIIIQLSIKLSIKLTSTKLKAILMCHSGIRLLLVETSVSYFLHDFFDMLFGNY